MKRSNYKYNRAGGVDCTLLHSIYGAIPNTLSESEVGDLPSGTLIEPCDPEKILEYSLECENNTARSMLLSTDWYVTRETETGKPIPQTIRELREAARLMINDLRG